MRDSEAVDSRRRSAPWRCPFSVRAIASLVVLIALPLATRAGDPPRIAPDELAARRARIIEKLREQTGGGFGWLLLRAPPPDHFAGDVDYLYRPAIDLYYLTGIDVDRCALLVASEPWSGERDAILFLDAGSEAERVWVGERPDSVKAAERAGLSVDAVISLDRLDDWIRSTARRGGKSTLWFETGSGFEPGRAPTEPYRFLLDTLGSDAFGLEIRPPSELTHPLREIKSEREIELLEGAIDVTEEAVTTAMRSARAGSYEYELRAAIEGTYLRRGMSWGFPSIIGSGPNSCVLHYQEYGRRMEKGDVVILDIGAENGFYSADISRTFPVSGRFTDRQRELYKIVLEAQRAGIEAVGPGSTIAEINDAARTTVARGLIELGMIESESEVRKYLMHGVSHGIGLDVHDPIVSRSLRPGMVVTVEPGIYVREESIGIRIEDDVLVTEDGHRVLSDGVPKALEEIERWMRRERL